MTTFKLLAAAAIMSAFIVSSASAQHMIDEPGMFAFVYPNGDLGIGSSRPVADAQAQAMAPPGRAPSGAPGQIRQVRHFTN